MLKKTTIRFCEDDLKSYFHFLNCFYVKNIHRGLAQNWHPSDTGTPFWKWKIYHKNEVESVQLGNTYITDMDKCPRDKYCLDKCRGDSCNLLYMFPGPIV